jgi:hypothetical protein
MPRAHAPAPAPAGPGRGRGEAGGGVRDGNGFAIHQLREFSSILMVQYPTRECP